MCLGGGTDLGAVCSPVSADSSAAYGPGRTLLLNLPRPVVLSALHTNCLKTPASTAVRRGSLQAGSPAAVINSHWTLMMLLVVAGL